jgi:hypothetical protein
MFCILPAILFELVRIATVFVSFSWIFATFQPKCWATYSAFVVRIRLLLLIFGIA